MTPTHDSNSANASLVDLSVTGEFELVSTEDLSASGGSAEESFSGNCFGTLGSAGCPACFGTLGSFT